MGVAHDGVRDAAHERPSEPSEPTASDHDLAGPDLVCPAYYGLVPPLPPTEVRPRDRASQLLDLANLLVEYLCASRSTASSACS